MIVENVMTKNAITASSDTAIGKALRILYELDFRHLPIVDGDELVGIVSDRDLRSLPVGELTRYENPELVNERMATSVSTVMSSDVVTIEPGTPLSEAIDIMVEQRIGAIPVVHTGTMALAGIVSYVDVLKALRKTA